MAKKTELMSSAKSKGKTAKSGAKAHFSEPASKKTDWQRKGCKEGEKRATFIVSEAQVEQMKNIAYWERIPLKEALAEALEAYIQKHKSVANKQPKK